MLRLRHAFAIAALAATVLALAQDRPFPLTVGDPAPALTTKEFVKGTPFTNFEKGQIYVVDMWATWCGPCRRSIPELTDLANKYRGKINCVGVSIWETDQSGIKPFVDKMGDKMNYTVAVDQWEKGAKNGRDGITAKAWMTASGMKNIGIPTCFVIGTDGDIDWIGHPDDLAKPLDEIVNGTFDRSAFADTYNAGMVKVKAKATIMDSYKQAINDKNWAAAESSADQLIAIDPSSALTKFDLFLNEEQSQDKALAYGQDLTKNLFKDDADSQTELAWDIANYEKAKSWSGGLDLALQCAQRALELKPSDSTYLMVLARVYNVRGDKDKAISTQKAAIAAATDPASKASLESDLKNYGG